MARNSPLLSFYTGVPIAGVNPTLLQHVQQAVTAAGGQGVYVTSAKREPGPSNDVKNSNHITGDALDGYAVVNGQRVPIGQFLVKSAGQYGLRSGDVAGFDPKTQGGYDPIHIDDGANVGGVHTYSPPGSAPTAPTSSLSGAVLQGLKKYPSLDPQAVLAVASQEGLSGGIGDGGHAFGPFQLNNAGGVITNKFQGQTPDQIQQWASSPAGIDYALAGINKVAAGQKGQQAVSSIVSGFERPANPSREIAGANAAYGRNYGSPTATPGVGLATPSAVAPSPQQIAAGQVSGLANGLATELQGAAQTMLKGGTPNLSNLFTLAKGYQQARASFTRTAPLGGTNLQLRAGGLKA